MNQVPVKPKIYHITHVDNLSKIIEAGRIWSDRKMLDAGFECNVVGLRGIKERRLNVIEVSCNRGTNVGDYVPFYLCPRSVMLSVFYYDNLPELTYHGGQEPIVHLEADMDKCAEWAIGNNRRFAFSDSNAGSFTAAFYNKKSDLDKIDWGVVNGTDFSNRYKKDRKAAEFLMHESFPWELVERIGVFDEKRELLATSIVRTASHQPSISIERSWYFGT